MVSLPSELPFVEVVLIMIRIILAWGNSSISMVLMLAEIHSISHPDARMTSRVS